MILMICWWIFTILNEQKKAELRKDNQSTENTNIEEIIDHLE